MRTFVAAAGCLTLAIIGGCGEAKPPKPTPKDDPSVKKSIENVPEISIGEEVDPSKLEPETKPTGEAGKAEGDKSEAGKSEPAGKAEAPQEPAKPPIPLPSGDGVGANAKALDLVLALGNGEQREAASAAVAQRGAPLVPELAQLLDHEHPQVRAQAAFALSLLGANSQPAAERLRALAAGDQHEASRDAARFALDAIAGK